MSVHVERIDKVAGILEQFPIMRFALPQYHFSTFTFAPFHGGEQALVISVGDESM
jgi:hypothetical protein